MTEKHMKPLTVDKCKRSENCYSYSVGNCQGGKYRGLEINKIL